MKVCELLAERKEWDTTLLTEAVLPCEASLIKGIDAIKCHGPDERYWLYEEKGKYTVKSEYGVETGAFEPPEFQSTTESGNWWGVFWKLIIPPKVRLFGWKVYHGYIPVKVQLRLHHVPVSGICWGCRRDWGSMVHTLFFCSVVKKVWKNSGFWEVLRCCYAMNSQSLMAWMWSKLSRDEFACWLVMTWMIWKGLYKTKHEEQQFDNNGIKEQAWHLIHQCRQARLALRSTLPQSRGLGSKVWSAPPEGSYRLDTDALFNPKLNQYGVGVIVRDSEGKVRGAWAKPMGKVRTVLEAEMVALLYGVGLCLQRNLLPVHVFTDSLLLVQLLKKGDEDGSMLKENLIEIFSLVKDGFITSISHARRSAVHCAHELAVFSGSIAAPVCWSDEIPDWLAISAAKDIR